MHTFIFVGLYMRMCVCIYINRDIKSFGVFCCSYSKYLIFLFPLKSDLAPVACVCLISKQLLWSNLFMSLKSSGGLTCLVNIRICCIKNESK